jgi:hypothetical protein
MYGSNYSSEFWVVFKKKSISGNEFIILDINDSTSTCDISCSSWLFGFDDWVNPFQW